jgi:hypothetical protein
MPKKDPKQKQDFVDRLYLLFLLWHCEACFVAFDRAFIDHKEARRIADVVRYPSFLATQRSFSEFESALAFAANISKMLDPKFFWKGEKLAALARGRRLRKILEIKKRDSVLRVLRRANVVRNHFEHIDLRLDKWAATTKGQHALMHALSADLIFVEKHDRFNRFNPDTMNLLMLTDKIDTRVLYEAVMTIWRAALKANRDIEDRQGLPGLR